VIWLGPRIGFAGQERVTGGGECQEFELGTDRAVLTFYWRGGQRATYLRGEGKGAGGGGCKENSGGPSIPHHMMKRAGKRVSADDFFRWLDGECEF